MNMMLTCNECPKRAVPCVFYIDYGGCIPEDMMKCPLPDNNPKWKVVYKEEDNND